MKRSASELVDGYGVTSTHSRAIRSKVAAATQSKSALSVPIPSDSLCGNIRCFRIVCGVTGSDSEGEHSQEDLLKKEQKSPTSAPATDAQSATSTTFPNGKPKEVSEAEKLVAHSLINLSLQEKRETTKITAEDDDFLRRKLEQLDAELTWLVKRKGTNSAEYERALFLSPRRVKRDSFRLMFLRADQFNPKKAAERMIRYFNAKVEVWGRHKLVQDITYQDLQDDDRQAIKEGIYQIRPDLRDKHGRVVSFLTETHGSFKNIASRLRVFWYLAMNAVRDNPDVQRHGMVAVTYSVNSAKVDNDFFEAASKGYIVFAFPLRMAGFHFCYNNPFLRHAVPLIQLSIGKSQSFGCHFGTPPEVKYEMQSDGFTEDSMPVDANCILSTKRHLEYIQEVQQRERETQQKEMETAAAQSVVVLDYPNAIDVLMGNGKMFQEHWGNVQLGRLIEKYRGQYLMAQTQSEKTLINQLVVQLVHEGNARFLKRDVATDGWVEVSNKDAWAKVTRLFRK